MFHEGGQYPCEKCDCRAAERGSLVRHIKSIHEGERCPCEKCDCKATQRGSLGQHIKSIHEGEQYLRFLFKMFIGMEIFYLKC